jgi:integrase
MIQVLAEPGSIGTGDYLGRWLAHVRGRVRAKTYEGYEGLIRLYAVPGIGEVPLSALHPLHLQTLYAFLLDEREPPLSGGTVLNLHLVLTQSLAQAVRWQILVANPASGAQPPRPRRKEFTTIDTALVARILEAVSGTVVELPAAIAIATGMRRGEILALHWSDIDEDLGTAHVRRTLQMTNDGLVYEQPKTKRSRRAVALPEFLRPYLLGEREAQERRRSEMGDAWCEQGLVVCRQNGSPVNPDTFSTKWPRMLARARLPHVRFHDLRHAHATFMLLQGVHPKVVSERLGHASVGITLDTYSHVLPEMQAEAARAFDDLFPVASNAPSVSRSTID